MPIYTCFLALHSLHDPPCLAMTVTSQLTVNLTLDLLHRPPHPTHCLCAFRILKIALTCFVVVSLGVAKDSGTVAQHLPSVLVDQLLTTAGSWGQGYDQARQGGGARATIRQGRR